MRVAFQVVTKPKLKLQRKVSRLPLPQVKPQGGEFELGIYCDNIFQIQRIGAN